MRVRFNPIKFEIARHKAACVSGYITFMTYV